MPEHAACSLENDVIVYIETCLLFGIPRQEDEKENILLSFHASVVA